MKKSQVSYFVWSKLSAFLPSPLGKTHGLESGGAVVVVPKELPVRPLGGVGFLVCLLDHLAGFGLS